MGDKPKIGLALGAGSVRGIAHIGVLQVLDKAGIHIDYLAGSSIGSMVGGFYAADLDLKRLEQLSYQMDWDLVTDLTVPRQGLIAGNKVKEFIKLLTQNKRFSDLKLPFAAVAADIQKGEEVVLREGLVADAIRASISIPGVYVPHEINDRLLVDGAILNRVPTNVIEDFGADIIIGVDVSYDVTQDGNVNNIFEIIMKTLGIMEREIMKYKGIDADVLIRPKVGHVPSRALDKAEECVAAGVKAAEEKVPKIKELIKRWEK
ncbi:patatin-like phospholipase family protein [Selenihalanaerobacter shriftii]|uniref:NTE family protein n=1 Tax=Selenihalanaerobacter shriftii TaxID=142842 RepID=A0A1T4PI31_9FIRM|nr:patatin-like phospholipase family protein [Selenihalanaerobacter shriftii]SJZ91152.1 NTE family protein [Selenihalanaerobacter shriftii]